MALSYIVLRLLCTGDTFGLLPGTMATKMQPRQECRRFIRESLWGIPRDPD